MAEGKYYDESGDFDEARDFDSLDRYREEDQAYLRAHSQTLLNGKPLEEDNKNTAGFGKFGRRRDEDGNSRWGLLRKGEKDASEKPNQNGKGGDKKASLGEKENNVESDDNSMGGKFKNAVKGVKDLKSGKVGKAKGRFKKAGPLAAILALCCGFGAASFFGQMAMPFSLMSVLQGNFDSISVSNLSRTNRMLRWQMKPSTRKTSTNADEFVKKHSKIYQKFTGKSEKYFDLSRKQVRKLAKAGIEVKTDSSTGEKVMNFKRANGEVSVITADDFKAKLDTDPDFNTAFQEGTKTWRKSVASWFDGKAKGFLKKIKVARNRFKDYRKGDDSAKNKQSYEETVKTATGDGDVDGKTGKAGFDNGETTDENGHRQYNPSINKEGEKPLELKRGAKAKEVETKLKNFSEGVGAKLAKDVTAVAKGSCVASEIVAAINMLVLASEAVQILQVASTVFEGIQKAQVGDSSGTPINEIGNSLTQNKTTTYKDKDDNKLKKEGSAMSSAGIAALFGNTATDTSDASVNSFNLTDSINSAMKAIEGGVSAYKKCLFVKIGAGIVDAVMDGVDIATNIAAVTACVAGAAVSFGLSCLAALGKIVGKKVLSATASISISTIIGQIVKFMVPKVATMMLRDLATNIGGEDFGNAIVSGANMLMGQNHQFGGGSLATKATLVTYLNEQQEYIAEQARYERQTRSPFDISSQYTFLGSLFARSVPLLTQTSSITSGIMNFGNTTLSAFSSIMPHASAMTSAVTAQKAAESTAKRCPELDGMGAVGDAFCNPYFITDFGTMDEDPAEIVYEVSKASGGKNFNESGEDEDVPVINEDPSSDLYKYIIYCGQRSATTFGMADQNIANSIDEGAGSVESSIPIWGSFADISQSKKHLDNFGYISGKACVTRNDGEGLGSDTISWEDAKKYQRFIEDQRLAENMGLVEKSSVTVALEHYYEKNPVDDSFEGVLAYYSGMSKEKVSDTLDFIEGVTWLAGYDPSALYPVKDASFKVVDGGKVAIDSEGNNSNYNYVIPSREHIIYRREYLIG